MVLSQTPHPLLMLWPKTWLERDALLQYCPQPSQGHKIFCDPLLPEFISCTSRTCSRYASAQEKISPQKLILQTPWTDSLSFARAERDKSLGAPVVILKRRIYKIKEKKWNKDNKRTFWNGISKLDANKMLVAWCGWAHGLDLPWG